MVVTIYGKPQCKYCDMAKQFCEMKGVEYKYLQVGPDISVEDLIEKCGQPVRSVPQIFFDDTFYVGGYDKLREMYDQYA